MKDWKTEFEFTYCEGTSNPRLYNFNWVRHGGRLGYNKGGMTLKESELIKIKELIEKLV